MEDIGIAIIGGLKDIIVAIIKALAGRPQKEKEKEKEQEKENLKTADEEFKKNPFLKSEQDIEDSDIRDPDYILTIATYLAVDRSPKDISIMDKEKNE